jgi:L-ascorbate metabolism protein UlaG (beta-lactamase superfamily)
VPDSLTYVGHATVLLELDGVRLLTDPVLRDRVAHLRRHGPSPAPVGALDAVLISHLHRDHFDRPSLRRLAGPPAAIVPAGAGRLLRRLGYGAVTQLSPGGSTRVGGLTVTAVPARHDGRRDPVLGATADAVGFVVGDRRRVYFAGDTDLFEGMAELGPLDVALLPVWGWGPTAGEGHLDPERAARAAALLRPRLVVPVHWGTLYPAGRFRRMARLLAEPPHEFARRVAAEAPGVEVRVLRPGETLSLDG